MRNEERREMRNRRDESRDKDYREEGTGSGKANH